MEMPWTCKTCGFENMVDFENLSIWQVNRLIQAKGFRCENCQTQQCVAYLTTSLEEQKHKMLRYATDHPKHLFLFKKSLRKAQGIYTRGEAVWHAQT